MKKSIRDRIKITKKGKVLHRVPGQTHVKAKRDSNQKGRKKKKKEMDISENTAKELMHR